MTQPGMTQPAATQKVALVTGASSGIGAATAGKLAGLGYTVYGAARRVDRMSQLRAAGVHVLAMDVTDAESVYVTVTDPPPAPAKSGGGALSGDLLLLLGGVLTLQVARRGRARRPRIAPC